MPEPNENLEKEIAHARALLQDIGRSVQMPQSLSSRALLPRLDDARRQSVAFWPKGLFSLQSGISYAVAFALIVVAFYAVRMGEPGDVIDGRFAVESATPSESEAWTEPLPRAVSEQDAAELESDPIAQAPAFAAMSLSDEEVPELSEGGMGGQGPTYLLGEAGGYSLAWRVNDPADPDREGAITLDVMDQGAIAAEVDIPDMERIDLFYVEEGCLFLVGQMEDYTVVRCYSGFEELELAPQGALMQPGILVGTRVYRGHIYSATVHYETDGDEAGIEAQPLAGSQEEGICYVGALSSETGETHLAAYQNSGGDITLFDRHLYISYAGAPGAEGEESERYVAQIGLNGLEIELLQVS